MEKYFAGKKSDWAGQGLYRPTDNTVASVCVKQSKELKYLYIAFKAFVFIFYVINIIIIIAFCV